VIRRWAAAGSALLVALFAAGPAGAARAVGAAERPAAVAAAADATAPTLRLSAPTAALGTYEIVTGSGFAKGAQVQLEVCGIGGSSNSCDLQDAVPATADGAGAFTVHLRVVEPPTPCPCTVHAAPFAGTAATPVDISITIPGLRFLPDAVAQSTGVAKLMDVAVTDDSSPFTQLGAKGSAQVTVTFANLSGGPADDPGVVLVLTHGSTTVGRYPVRWAGDALAVGQRRSLIYDVPLPGGWFRDFSIAVVLGRAGAKQVTARTLPASVRPWGELVAPLALLLGVGLLLLGRRRHYEVVPALPVREGAPAGRRNGVVEPVPFVRIEPLTLGVAELPPPPTGSRVPAEGSAPGPALPEANPQPVDTCEPAGEPSTAAEPSATTAELEIF
jgi:hypothetical protein